MNGDIEGEKENLGLADLVDGITTKKIMYTKGEMVVFGGGR